LCSFLYVFILEEINYFWRNNKDALL
jgi:hypothetical protein